MKENLNLIVMLTHNDKTVKNSFKIFEECQNSKAKLWGFKEKPLPVDEMKKLYKYMKKCGKMTFLEVVEYTEKEGLEGAKLAVECGCDILMGTVFFDSINEFCKSNNLKYMPFVGKVTQRPSILKGDINEIIAEAKEYQKKGVYGFDLLGYRYVGDAVELNKKFVEEIEVPVCLAGSINSYMRLDEVKNVKPWAFTIGSAFFENKFDGTFKEQINKVYEYIEN
jgi:hypothetical protein